MFAGKFLFEAYVSLLFFFFNVFVGSSQLQFSSTVTNKNSKGLYRTVSPNTIGFLFKNRKNRWNLMVSNFLFVQFVRRKMHQFLANFTLVFDFSIEVRGSSWWEYLISVFLEQTRQFPSPGKLQPLKCALGYTGFTDDVLWKSQSPYVKWHTDASSVTVPFPGVG